MKKEYFRNDVIVFMMLLMILVSWSTFLVYAEDRQIGTMHTDVLIVDPKTDKEWSWNLDNDSKLIHMDSKLINVGKDVYNLDEPTVKQSVTVDVTPLLNETLKDSYPSQSHSLTDGIKITAGLKYSAYPSNNTVRLRGVFGSTKNIGNYYATNRNAKYSNPILYDGKKVTITGSSWNKILNEPAGQYVSGMPPYTTAWCRVNITGMTAYRTVYVTCKLDL